MRGLKRLHWNRLMKAIRAVFWREKCEKRKEEGVESTACLFSQAVPISGGWSALAPAERSALDGCLRGTGAKRCPCLPAYTGACGKSSGTQRCGASGIIDRCHVHPRSLCWS